MQFRGYRQQNKNPMALLSSKCRYSNNLLLADQQKTSVFWLFLVYDRINPRKEKNPIKTVSYLLYRWLSVKCQRYKTLLMFLACEVDNKSFHVL